MDELYISIKVYNKIYIFWSYSNQKVIFWFIILFNSFCLYTVLLGVYVRISLLTFGFYTNFPHYFEFIRHCYDRIYAYNDRFVCPEGLTFYKVILTIYVPLKSILLCSDFEPGPRWCERMHAERQLIVPQKAVLVDIWAYSFILTWIGNWMFFGGPGMNIYIYKLSKFFALSFPRIYICKCLYII